MKAEWSQIRVYPILQWQEICPIFPFIGFTCLENCQQVINNFSDWQRIPNKNHTGHWQILGETIMGMFPHRIQIMGE